MAEARKEVGATQGRADGSKSEKERLKVVVRNRRRDGYFREMMQIGLVVLVAITAMAAALGAYLYSKYARSLPEISSVTDYEPLLGTRLYADDGTMIAEYAEQTREVISYDLIPKYMLLALIASEDGSFFEHNGLNYVAIVRAMIENIKAGGIVQGGSTITQQLAKTFFLTPEKALRRKVREAELSWRVEERLTKEEILYLYANQIYLGHGAYGVQSAARHYYGKDVWDLNLAEMTLIAGLPKAPSRFSPLWNWERARERQEYVLRRMVDEGFITQRQREEALQFKVDLIYGLPHPDLEYGPHFTEHVRRYIAAKYGDRALYREGLEVLTTMNIQAQWMAENAVYLGLRSLQRRVGYQGVRGHLAAVDWPEFFDNYNQANPDQILLRDRIYPGIVTEIQEEGRRSSNWYLTIRVGDRKGRLWFKYVDWAREPNENRFWESDGLRKLSGRFKVGDLVLVRPSDQAGIEESDDHRSTNPIPHSDEDLLWTLETGLMAQAALLVKDVKSGAVKAMVGGWNYEESQFNRAYQSCRQPGSSFKPVVYTTFVEQGGTPASMILDAGVVNEDDYMRWKPRNTSSFRGKVTLREAIVNSINNPAIRVLRKAGLTDVMEMARKLGIRSPLRREEGLALGASCVTLDEMTDVYAHFPRLGRKPDTHYIRVIFDRRGEVLEDHRVAWDPMLTYDERLARMEVWLGDEPEQVIAETAAYVMSYLLQEVVNSGTGYAAYRAGQSRGGKTGTTNDNFDAWFVGFTPYVVAAAWIGFDKNDRHLGVGETGSKAALPIWADFMDSYHEHQSKASVDEPAGIVWRKVDPETGLLWQEGIRRFHRMPFRRGTEPEEYAPKPGEVDPSTFYKEDW